MLTSKKFEWLEARRACKCIFSTKVGDTLETSPNSTSMALWWHYIIIMCSCLKLLSGHVFHICFTKARSERLDDLCLHATGLLGSSSSQPHLGWPALSWSWMTWIIDPWISAWKIRGFIEWFRMPCLTGGSSKMEEPEVFQHLVFICIHFEPFLVNIIEYPSVTYAFLIFFPLGLL